MPQKLPMCSFCVEEERGRKEEEERRGRERKEEREGGAACAIYVFICANKKQTAGAYVHQHALMEDQLRRYVNNNGISGKAWRAQQLSHKAYGEGRDKQTKNSKWRKHIYTTDIYTGTFRYISAAATYQLMAVARLRAIEEEGVAASPDAAV